MGNREGGCRAEFASIILCNISQKWEESMTMRSRSTVPLYLLALLRQLEG